MGHTFFRFRFLNRTCKWFQTCVRRHFTTWSKAYRNPFLRAEIAALFVDLVAPANEASEARLEDVITEQQKHKRPIGTSDMKQGKYWTNRKI